MEQSSCELLSTLVIASYARFYTPAMTVGLELQPCRYHANPMKQRDWEQQQDGDESKAGHQLCTCMLDSSEYSPP